MLKKNANPEKLSVKILEQYYYYFIAIKYVQIKESHVENSFNSLKSQMNGNYFEHNVAAIKHDWIMLLNVRLHFKN